MPEAERKLSFQSRPEPIWKLLSDLANWPRLFQPATLIRRDLAFEPLPAPPANRFALKVNGSYLTTWEVTEWAPPNRFAASVVESKRWLPRVSGSFAFTIAPVNSLDTEVVLRLEFGVAEPGVGDLVNWLFRVQSRCDETLERLSKRLTALLSQE